jgi:lambda family phage minor tail protein L
VTVSQDVQKLEPGALVELYELDGAAVGADMFRFHGMTSVGSVWWQGNEYSPWPIRAQGFARTSDRPPEPKLLVGNLDGSISALCMYYDDMVGAKVVRHRTFAKYLDKENFPGADLVVNGYFGDFAGWDRDLARAVIVANGAKVSNSLGVSGHVSQQIMGTEAGSTYVITVTVAENTTVLTSGVRFLVGGVTHMTSATAAEYHDLAPGMVGNYYLTVTAPQDDFWITLTVREANKYAVIKSIKVQAEGVNPTADPMQEMPPESWFIERKSGETHESVEFELASPLDFNGVMLPRRQIIANMCSWTYRGAECGYLGGPVATLLDEPTSDPTLDRCAKHLNSCKLRFGENVELPFGGFPAAGLVRT